MAIYISVPHPIQYTTSILPVFLPFLGCKQRCIFCSQHVQTGVITQEAPALLSNVRQQLDARIARHATPVELGFFGGTFTCLSASVLQDCMTLIAEYTRKGAVVAARCSTRPDAVSPTVLQELRDGGFTTVELGVQSFATDALQHAQRGYDGPCAQRACAQVRAAGLQLGVQLLPGMPGVSTTTFVNDVATALDCGAQLLRFYPCLVIDGTALATLWRQGAFTPWSLDNTVDALATGYAMAMARNIPVIRMGLAPEKTLLPHILAGPEHPALGSMVQGLALLRAAEHALQGQKAHNASIPRWCQGFFWGHRQALRPRWAAMGVQASTLTWTDSPESDRQCAFSI